MPMRPDEFKTKLKDGTDVLIRTVRPCDKDCISEGFDRLSPRTRRLRFFSPIHRLTDAQLTYLADVNDVDRVAIGACEVSGERATGVGLARYARLAEEPDVAEFAITIADAYQGRGAGPILLDLLIEHAQSNGIRALRGYVLKSNAPMLKLLERYAPKQITDEGHALRVDLEIEPPGRTRSAPR